MWTERRIIALRFTRRWGTHRIHWHLQLSHSTVEKDLRRYRMPRLSPGSRRGRALAAGLFRDPHGREIKTAVRFWQRAPTFFETHGTTVLRVLADNGFCYRSHAFAQALRPDIKPKFATPRRPQTNGKVERFNRTRTRTRTTERAHAKPYKSEGAMIADGDAWLHHYNYHRLHTGIEGRSPLEAELHLRRSLRHILSLQSR